MLALTKTHASLAVDIRHLSVGYPGGHYALEDIHAGMAQGSICAVLGSNGGGKSTLCKTLMGILKPAKGSVMLFGHSIQEGLHQNAVAYVPQTEQIDWDFPVSVHDVVMMGRQGRMNWLRIPSRKDRRIVAESLDRVGMLKFSGRQIGELSGGQKKRVFIARALAQQARLMLLDEPFTGVDVTTENDILGIMREERDAGMALMVVTHNLSSVPDYSDEVLMLNKRMITFGSTNDHFTAENLGKTFGGVVNELLKVVDRSSHESMRQVAS